MPQRNSENQDQQSTIIRRSPRFVGNITQIQEEPISILRRSKRFLGKKRNESDDPRTPSHEKRKAKLPFAETNSSVSTPNASLKASETGISQARNLRKELNFGTEEYAKQNKGSRKSEQLKAGGGGLSILRRSARLSGKENVNSRIEPSNLYLDEFKKEDDNLREEFLGIKGMRVTPKSTRKAFKEMAYNGTPLARIDCNSTKSSGRSGFSDKRSVEVPTGLPVQSVGKTKKTNKLNQGNAKRPAKKCIKNRIDRCVEDSKAEFLDNGASLSVERKAKSGLRSSEQAILGSSSRAALECRVEREAKTVEKKQKCIGVKRKRNQVEGDCRNHGLFSGWTKDQETALQRAYFSANPTPHFWKKVARMVPGKSAKDCFDRIHADHLTPSQPQPRSRAKLLNLSPLSFSASKLLDSIKPKSKRPRRTKQKSFLLQRTMRQLMQKQCQVDRDQNADLFSLFEPDLSPSTNALQQGGNYSTPKQEKPKLLRRCQERSSSARRKQCSRFNSLNEISLASPPVLKPVKNKALHEKYIDQLHAREAKRKAASARAAKSGLQILDWKQCPLRKNAIQSAKNALLLDASDAIKQFQHVHANDLKSFSDIDDDVLYSDEDINEGENRL